MDDKNRVSPSEADKEETRKLARLLGGSSSCVFDIGAGVRFEQAIKEIAHIRAEACAAERAYVAELRLVIKYALEKDAEDGYSMHPYIVERLQAALDDTAAKKELESNG